MINCSSCGSEQPQVANFCSECGSKISIIKKFAGFAQNLKERAQIQLDELKNSLDTQISKYTYEVENGGQAKFAGITIPEKRQSAVKNALTSIQDKFLAGDPLQTEEYNSWLEDLPERLKDHNCIVCFGKWNSEDNDIVVCPHCQSGGHKSHIENWIKNKSYCPLCRSDVRFNEFIQIVS